MNEETAHARELILLFRDDLDCEFNIGQVGAGELETLGSLGFINFDSVRLGVVAGACMKFLERLRVLLSNIGAGIVSVGSHARSIGNPPAAVTIPRWPRGDVFRLDRANRPHLRDALSTTACHSAALAAVETATTRAGLDFEL